MGYSIVQTDIYKKYVGLITQTSNSDPTITVLENNIGNIIFTRDNTGEYIGTLIGAFPEDKTFVLFSNYDPAANYSASWYDEDTIQINTQNSGGTPIDGALSKNTLEIRVYP